MHQVRKSRAGALRGDRGTAWVLPQTLPEGVRSLVEKPKPLKQLASPNFGIPEWKPVNVIDLNQTELLSFLRERVKAARQTRNRSAIARQIAVSD